ncbi:hypothetical protein OKA04_05885 [Luteolibacter flavescens]|uniref:Uncharacterized protein n=1 Tax=Luteolibacter flavescens TaxID=1859460 RepID=A0ABT3FL02_9BACT|nr:hypothetical protein [Luteolibacter flavescens]MCW1884253.1 hypothetical protein [Luteolibacter flavescens]
MKATLFSALLLCAQAFGAGEGYTNFISQIQQDTGVVWNMPVVPQGNSPSALVLEGKGSLFQLWTIQQASATDYLLDQKLVGAYMPAATISIKTADPYTKVPRTRADQPFTVNYEVSKLLSGANLPVASTRVLLEHHTASYAAGQSSIPLTTAISGKPLTSAYISTNGPGVLSFPVTNLKATDPTKATGEEHFVIHALSDGTITQSQIANAYVQIWPVASGTIAGVKEGERIRYNAPPLTLTLKDLYPDSYTWLQVYPGPPKLNTEGVTVQGSQLVIDQDKSHSDILSVSNYDTVFPQDGTYTMELLTQTPFGIDRLSYVSVEVDRKLEIRAQMGEISSQ